MLPTWLYRTIVWLSDGGRFIELVVFIGIVAAGDLVAGGPGIALAVVATWLGALLMMLHDIRETNL